MLWETIGRPGYFGAFRDQRFAEYDKQFGKGNWRIAWVVADLTLDFLGACALYEDAYMRFLELNSIFVGRLVRAASDVYDDSLSNISSGLDYTKQETQHTHIQDIALRRCLVRMGKGFLGKEPIQIRDEVGTHPLSMTLSPGRIPFHIPLWIKQPEVAGWWNPGSIESFYQSNKVLQVNKKVLQVKKWN